MLPSCPNCGGYKYPNGYIGDAINSCSCRHYIPYTPSYNTVVVDNNWNVSATLSELKDSIDRLTALIKKLIIATDNKAGA